LEAQLLQWMSLFWNHKDRLPIFDPNGKVFGRSWILAFAVSKCHLWWPRRLYKT
jgi:hypothetical protein